MHVELQHKHSWQVSPREAIGIQRELARYVREESLGAVRTIAGVDVSVRGQAVQAAIAVLAFPSLEVVDRAIWNGDVQFPYVPGLLSFREVPAILPAIERLKEMPDVFMTDSQGYAHPRRFGLACHLGVLLDRPTFGVAKTRLTGAYAEPDSMKGSRSVLLGGEEVIGTVLRTRTGVKPVYVSIGHRITLEEAVDLALLCSPRYRIPEPTRQAHNLSRVKSLV